MTGDGRTSVGIANPDSRCPGCGTTTAASRTVESGIGSVSMDELETLVRSEWRRRLGKEAYRRPHRRRFVRALLDYALSPESRLRRSVLEDALWDEVAALEVWGLSRWDAEIELYGLVRAMWTVLETTGLSEEKRQALTHRMDDWLQAELGWPVQEWEQVRDLEGPLF